MRAWALFRLNATGASLRELEGETDVAKSSIDKFVKRQALPSKIWPKLRVWFLKDRHARYASLQDPGEMALLILESLGNLPGERLAAALLRTADHYEELHRQAHAPVPGWIDGLRSLARSSLPAQSAASPEYPVPRRRGRKRKDPNAQAPGHRPDPRDED